MLLAGDVVAIMLARVVAVWLMTGTAFGSVSLPASPLITGGTRFVFLAVLTLVAVFATGGHSRHRVLNQPMRLFVAVAGAVLLNWAGGIARGFLSDLVLPMIATAGILWLSLLAVRQLSEWILRHVWPGSRGAGAAILIGAPIAARRFEEAIAAPGGDYRVVGYVAADRADTDDYLGLLIGIHPGASLVEKRWPLERFQEVAAAIQRECGVRVLAFAEPSGYGSELFEMHGVVGAQVGLRELMALIECCKLLVCNDSGPMHIAGALGVPTVAMFGPGIEHWFSPLGDGDRLLSSADDETPPTAIGERIGTPTAITTSQVLEAVRNAVREVRAGATFSTV